MMALITVGINEWSDITSNEKKQNVGIKKDNKTGSL